MKEPGTSQSPRSPIFVCFEGNLHCKGTPNLTQETDCTQTGWAIDSLFLKIKTFNSFNTIRLVLQLRHLLKIKSPYCKQREDFFLWNLWLLHIKTIFNIWVHAGVPRGRATGDWRIYGNSKCGCFGANWIHKGSKTKSIRKKGQKNYVEIRPETNSWRESSDDQKK